MGPSLSYFFRSPFLVHLICLGSDDQAYSGQGAGEASRVGQCKVTSALWPGLSLTSAVLRYTHLAGLELRAREEGWIQLKNIPSPCIAPIPSGLAPTSYDCATICPMRSAGVGHRGPAYPSPLISSYIPALALGRRPNQPHLPFSSSLAFLSLADNLII